MTHTQIYEVHTQYDVVLPAALEEAFTEFLSASGMPFAPQVTTKEERSSIHFLFLNKKLEDLVDEFLLTFEPDGFHAIEIAVPNNRLKHVIRVGQESNWIPFIRHEGAERTRVCFVRTRRSVTASELEERIELVS
jgi:hypothetical protein